MRHDLEVGYLGIQVPDPTSLNTFFGEVIGLVPGAPARDPATVTWRNDGKAHRLLIEPGPANDASFVGFEAVDDAAFDRVAARLAASGYDVTPGTDTDLAERRVARMVHSAAPWGVRVELVHGLEEWTTPFASPSMPRGFLTEDVGFGHVVFATTAFEESHRFLVDGLGFAQSDWVELQISEGVEIEVRFYHCNARHHSVAVAHAPFELPQRLNHVMFETNDRDDVGAAFDRAWATDLAIPMGLGVHDNDRMFSFYVASPAGFQVEVGYGARTISDPWDDNRRYRGTSAWGHKPLRAG